MNAAFASSLKCHPINKANTPAALPIKKYNSSKCNIISIYMIWTQYIPPMLTMNLFIVLHKILCKLANLSRATINN